MKDAKEIVNELADEVLRLERRQFADDAEVKSKRMSKTRRTLLDVQVRAWTDALAVALDERSWPERVSAFLDEYDDVRYVNASSKRSAVRARLYGK